MSSLALTKPAGDKKLSHKPRQTERTKEETLSVREAQFIANYTSINTHTYGNGVRSYLQSHKTDNYNTACVEASKLLRKPKISYAIRQIESSRDQKGKVRTSRLESVLNGEYVQVQTRKRLSETIDPKSGEKVSLISEEEYTKTPSAGEVVSAANVLNKMDGTYQTAEAMGSLLSLELKTAFKKSIRPASMQAVIDGETVDGEDLAAENTVNLPLKESLTAESLEKHGVMTQKLPLNDSIRGGEDISNGATDNKPIDTDESLTKSRDNVESITVNSIHDSIQADTAQGMGQDTGEGGAGSPRAHKIPPNPTASNFSNLEDEIEEEIYLEMLNEGL